MAGSIPATSGRIFMSYRREETAYAAGWLHDRLTDRFGSDQVFEDINSIELGDDFVQVITRAVGSCDVLLALIGDQWLTTTDEHGRRRLDDPNDFVRLEIEAALTRNVRVIPILVDGARMPRADELPDSLVKLVHRQALELSPSRFDFAADRLLKVLDRTLAEVRTTQDDAAVKAAPSETASTPTRTEVQETPRRPGQEEQRATSSTPPAALVPPAGARPPSNWGEAPDKQRRPLSTRPRILAGVAVAVGVVLILLVVAIVTNSKTTPPSSSTATLTKPTNVGVEDIKITSPKNNDKISGQAGVLLHGTAKRLEKGYSIWVIDVSGDTYYRANERPIPVNRGNWEYLDRPIGETRDPAGTTFRLGVVRASPECANSLQTARPDHGVVAFKELPRGCTIEDTVDVIKEWP
jgi:hypothetical protein